MTVYCGAKTRGGDACRRPGGWGTHHPGEGKCKLHGGASRGAPKGNKNAVVHGGYETIWLDELTEEERELYGRIDTSPKAQAEEEIRLLCIRERRMLGRIRDLEKDGATPERVRAAEEALSGVQQRKARYVEILRKIEATAPQAGEPLAGLVEALERSCEAAQNRRGE